MFIERKRKDAQEAFFSRPLPGRIVIVITYKQKRETLRKKKKPTTTT